MADILAISKKEGEKSLHVLTEGVKNKMLGPSALTGGGSAFNIFLLYEVLINRESMTCKLSFCYKFLLKSVIPF